MIIPRYAKLFLLVCCLVRANTAIAQESEPFSAWLAETAIPEEEMRAPLQTYLIDRVPAYIAPETRDDWQRQARDTRARYRNGVIVRDVPDAWRDHNVRVEWVEDLQPNPSYRIRKLRYEALPGLWIPALLYEPDEETGKAPVVLNVNGHVGAPGKSIDYEQIRCINLAKRGMISLHPEWLACGELSDPAYSHNNLAYLNSTGIGGVSVFYYALSRALDVLLDHPRADTSRVAMTGLSGGGWQTAVFCAIDERVNLIAPNAGHGGMKPRIESLRDMGDLEQVPVDFLTVADYSHVTALFAPRPALLIYNAEDNCCFKADVALPTVWDPVLPLYERFGNASDFRYHINIDPGTHNYELDNRLQFYTFIEEHFAKPSDRVEGEIPFEGEVLSFDELNVGIPEDNATFQSLALAHSKTIEPPVFDAHADAVNALHKIIRWEQPEITATPGDSTTVDGLTLTPIRIETPHGPIRGLTVQSDAANSEWAVYVSDTPLNESAPRLRELAESHGRVLAIEPVLLGSSQPFGNGSWQFAMAIEAIGERVLGIQAAQIAAACRWLHTQGGDQRRIYADGPAAATAALVAAIADERTTRKLTLTNGIESLTDAIEQGMSWQDYPGLFCYGLMTVADIPALKEIALDSGVLIDEN